MDKSKVKVKYNGRRFPRIVTLRAGGKTAFQPNRKVLELDEYDALYLLRSNSRITPDKWEFAVQVSDQEDIDVEGWSEGQADRRAQVENPEVDEVVANATKPLNDKIAELEKQIEGMQPRAKEFKDPKEKGSGKSKKAMSK